MPPAHPAVLALGVISWLVRSSDDRNTLAYTPPVEQLSLDQFGLTCERLVADQLGLRPTTRFPDAEAEQQRSALSGSSADGWRWDGQMRGPGRPAVLLLHRAGRGDGEREAQPLILPSPPLHRPSWQHSNPKNLSGRGRPRA